MLHNTFIKCKNDSNWERYRKQRKHVNRIKRQSINTYFYERCLGGSKSSDFWPTIKPFLSNKSNNCKKDIILVEDNKIINNQTEVSEIVNNFFINVAKDIGWSNIKSDESHPSISKIIANTPDIENLVFHDIKEDFIIKQINKINITKATGRDGISAKIQKIAKPVIAKPISELVNKSISLSKFPKKT